MRRGLMHWDPQELPVAVLEQRIAGLRGAMQSAGLDAFIIYTNLVRPSAVAHLTGFTPYWSEGLLLVPMTGRLAFATALSNRVADWIRSTNPVSEVVSTPRPGRLVGERLANDASVKRVGVLELDAMPSELADDLAAAAPALQWIDGRAPFATIRRRFDAAEQRILAHADALAVAALDQVNAAASLDAGTVAGLVEQHARLAGAEEVYVALAPDLAADRRLNRISKPMSLADRFAVRASLAYKGSWVRRTRTFAKDDTVAQADAWFADVARGIEAGKPIAGQLAARLEGLPGATLAGWMVESCLGSYPLAVAASSRMPGNDAPSDGSFLVLTIELMLDSGPWIGSAPVIVGMHDLSAVITRASG
jgi:hypothetical protein